MQRPSTCNHCSTWPCCGCGTEPSQEEQREQLEAMEDLAGVDVLDDEDDENEEPKTDKEPWDGFRSDAEADQDALNSVYGYDPEDCDTPMGDDYGGE